MTAPEAINAKRAEWFTTTLGLFQPGRLVDVGAGHGLHAIEAADAGWQVTAVDARGDRFPDDPRIEWQVGDVRDVDYSTYDLVLCLGLWYHLTADDQLGLLKAAQGTPIILDTHVANNTEPGRHPLSEEVEQHGYRGQLYTEPDQATNSPASWGNDQSFWPRPRALFRMLDDHGYAVLTASPYYQPSRTFYVCVPWGKKA